MKELLNSNGKLIGLLFDAKLNDNHPPFGGNTEEYISYFESHFTMDVFTKCYNSFPNRQEMELFVKFMKK
jgi:thiopurine S-methyltransferase